MKRLVTVLIGAPLAIVLVVFAVANRQSATLRLDPFNAADPAIAFTAPFFVFLFGALIVGLLLGGVVSWWSHGRNRHDLRAARRRLAEIENAPPGRGRTDAPVATPAAETSALLFKPANRDDVAA